MARSRVIYQSEGLFVSNDINSTGVSDHYSVSRVQSANYGFSISRQDVNQYGQLGRIDSLVLEAPTVNLDFSYYLTNGTNESALGFSTDPSVGFLSGLMGASSGQNVYVLTSFEGEDLDSDSYTGFSVISVGNAYLTDYTLDFGIGQIPTVSTNFEAANISSQIGLTKASGENFTGIINASVNPITNIKNTNQIELSNSINDNASVAAIMPKNVDVTISGGGLSTITNLSTNEEGAHIQTASLSVSTSRSSLERFGTTIPYARVIDFPVTVNFSVNALVNELTERNMADLLQNESGIYIDLDFKDQDNITSCKYTISGAKLDSESFSSSIGSNKLVDLSFSAQVGGPRDLQHNIFFSGTAKTNEETVDGALLTEDGFFLTTESSEILIVE